MIVLILVSSIILLLPLGKLLIVGSFLVFGVLSFLGPLCRILLVVTVVALIVLVHPILVRATPVACIAVRHAKVVTLLRAHLALLRVLGLERGRWILMPLVIGIFPSLHLLRVVGVRLKLDVLLLFKKLLLVVDDFHLSLKHFVEAVILLLILNPLNELHQNVLAPFCLHFVVGHLLDGHDDRMDKLDSLLLSFAIPLLFWAVLRSDRVLKHKVSKLTLNDSVQI